MKLAVLSLLVLLVAVTSAHGRWGRGRGGRGGGEACTQDSDCDAATEKCATTKSGNKCKIPKECAADADCTGGDKCFKDTSNSANPSLGYCNGCSSTDATACDTANGESCIIYGDGTYGSCGVSCTAAADCTATQFCTGAIDCGRRGRGRRRGGDKPSFCKDKKATGERCCDNTMCTSGTCTNNRCT